MRTLKLIALTLSLCPATLSAQTPGKFTPLGTGCGDPGRPIAVMSSVVVPEVGKVFEFKVSNLPPNMPGVIIAGESATIWNGATLPLNLGFLGAPNCTLYSSGECLGWCATEKGTVTLKAGIPNDQSLIGVTFYSQFWFADPKSNAAGFGMSNGGKFEIGG